MELKRVLSLLEPVMSDQVARWRTALQHADATTVRLLERRVRSTMQRLRNSVGDRLLLPPPSEAAARGDLELGTILYERSRGVFGLKEQELMQGLGIYGRSGAGKTNVVFGLVQQLHDRGIPFLFLDWKRTCRNLLPSLAGRVDCFTPGRSLAPLPFNSFVVPPGADERVHASQVVDLIGSAYTLGDGAKSILLDAIRALEGKGSTPTLDALEDEVRASPTTGRSAGWRASALRALQSLTFIDLVESGGVQQTDLVARLCESSTVIELDALDDGAKRFLVPELIHWIYNYRLQATERERLRLVIIIEEAHHLLLRREIGARESLIERVLRQCREIGIGVVVVDQHPHLMSSAAIGNAYASICLNLRNPADIAKAAALSGLEDDDKPGLAGLPVGQGVVKLQDRWRQPFLVTFPHVRIEKGAVTDGVLRRYLQQRSTRSSVGRPEDVRTSGNRRVQVAKPVEGDALALLLDCAHLPADGVRRRYERLGFSMAKGGRTVQALRRWREVIAEWYENIEAGPPRYQQLEWDIEAAIRSVLMRSIRHGYELR